MLRSLALAAALEVGHSLGDPAFRAPNVVLVVLDDVGAEQLSMYGVPAAWGETRARTPVLDHVRANGVLFERAWGSPMCSPTRAMLLSGRHGFRTGLLNLAEVSGPCPPGSVMTSAGACCPVEDPTCALPGNTPIPPFHPQGYSLPEAEVTLAEALRDAQFPAQTDYARGLFGKWHVAGRPDDPCHAIRQGFELFQGHLYNNEGGGRHHYDWIRHEASASTGGCVTSSANVVGAWDAEVTALDARAWIDAQRAAPDPRPFLAWVAFNAPHRPFQVPPQALVSPQTWSELQLHGLAIEGLEVAGVRSCQAGTSQATDSRAARLVHRAALEAVDALIGRIVLETPGETALLADTLVIVIGDNGTPDHILEATQNPEELGVHAPPFWPNRGKFQVYELGVRVPLVVAGLDTATGGTCASLVSAVDLWSTVLEVAGADAGGLSLAGELDSRSFAARLRQPSGAISTPERSEIYTEVATRNGFSYSPAHQAWTPFAPGGATRYQRALLDSKGYKYIRRVVGADPGCSDPGPCTLLPDEEVFRVRVGQLPYDPFESTALCGSVGADAQQARLRLVLATRYSGD
jgi:arylsulfatase A-like enzyme